MNFNQGDIVILKSGGPEMTVKKVIGTHTSNEEEEYYRDQGYSIGDLVCEWFTDNKKITDAFIAATVEIA
ncbi:MAG: DUF2158 domain-containing protein [Flavobacteriales bacterium]|nr:DUF2158 domain-containing protein [Flavobacteriales bacterium]